MIEKRKSRDLFRIPISPVVDIIRQEAMKYIKDAKIQKGAKFFMVELIEAFIRDTIKEVMIGGYMRKTKTITAEEIERALRMPPDISILRNQKVSECLKKAYEKLDQLEISEGEEKEEKVD